jgi:hypothetical protein
MGFHLKMSMAQESNWRIRMKYRQFKTCGTVFLFCCLLWIASRDVAAEEISLNQAGVVVDVSEASYIHYTIVELRRQIELLTGYAPILFYDLEEALKTDRVDELGLTIPVRSLVVVGRAMSDRLAQLQPEVTPITDQYPGEQGIVLKSMQAAGGRNIILAAGSDSHGTNYAVMELRQLLTESSSGFAVPGALDLLDKPSIKVRGMFIHQHWRFNYPYCPWSWSVDEWKRVVDTLAYMRYNLLIPFAHTDIMAPRATPSTAEKEYLDGLREVIDYAHRRRGMKVWLMESANILQDRPEDAHLAPERRDHYRSEWGWPSKREHPRDPGMKDPTTPEDFAALMAQRESVFRHVPNADGFGCITTDPGRRMPWATSAEFVDLFVGYRELLERHHERPDEVTQFIWLNEGWGTGSQEENWRDMLSDWVKRVEGPRNFQIWFWDRQAPVVKEVGEMSRTSLMTHALTGGGNDIGFTKIHFGEQARISGSGNLTSAGGIRKVFDQVAEYPELVGITANALTYLVEFPNFHFFANHAPWSSKDKKADDLTILRDAAKYFFPENAELLAQAWAQLAATGSQNAFAAADRIEALLEDDRTGRTGTVGAFVFPQPTQLLEDLVRMVRIHAAAEKVREEVERDAGMKEVRAAVVDCMRKMLDWQKMVGYFGAYGPGKLVSWDWFRIGPDSQTVIDAWGTYMQNRDDREQVHRGIFKELCMSGYTHWIVYSLVGQHLWGYQPGGWGGFLHSNKFNVKKYIDDMPDRQPKQDALRWFEWYQQVFGETSD